MQSVHCTGGYLLFLNPMPLLACKPRGDKPKNSRRKRLSTASKASTASKMFQHHSCARNRAPSLQKAGETM